MFTRRQLAKYPVVALADATNWAPYSDGIFDKYTNNLNHGVLIVGFEATGAWIVKNWFGTGWGENGYIRLDQFSDCGVNSVILVPNLKLSENLIGKEEVNIFQSKRGIDLFTDMPKEYL